MPIYQKIALDLAKMCIRDRVRRGAKARTTKQRARLQRFDELSNKNDFTPEDKLEISVGSSRLGKKIIEIEHLTKAFDGKTFIDDLDYTLARTDRIGIVGKNGLGKSTLIRLLNDDIKPDCLLYTSRCV